MNKRTKIALLFLGNLLLLIGFFFLPWYIAPFNTHGHLLEGPSAWNLMTFPFVAQTVPQTVPKLVGGFLLVTPFWLLAALIIFELGGEIWKLRRRQRISTSRLYKNIGQIGLLLCIIIFILSCLNYAEFRVAQHLDKCKWAWILVLPHRFFAYWGDKITAAR